MLRITTRRGLKKIPSSSSSGVNIMMNMTQKDPVNYHHHHHHHHLHCRAQILFKYSASKTATTTTSTILDSHVNNSVPTTMPSSSLSTPLVNPTKPHNFFVTSRRRQYKTTSFHNNNNNNSVNTMTKNNNNNIFRTSFSPITTISTTTTHHPIDDDDNVNSTNNNKKSTNTTTNAAAAERKKREFNNRGQIYRNQRKQQQQQQQNQQRHHNNRNHHHRRRRSPSQSSSRRIDLKELMERLSLLMESSSSLSSSTSVVLPYDDNDDDELLESVSQIVRDVEKGLMNGWIKPSRDIHTLSHLLATTLKLLSTLSTPSPSSSSPSPRLFPLTLSILSLLHNHSLPIPPPLINTSIIIASKESLWNDAADLFQCQLEDELVPMDATLGWGEVLERGLYAVAMAEKGKEGGDVRGRVWDCVRCMRMVCPQDGEKYVTAAINTFGRIGDVDAGIEYLKTLDKRDIDQPLITTLMLNLLSNNQPQKALMLFQTHILTTLTPQIPSEYQTCGTDSPLLPSCRDAAIRAYATAAAGDDGGDVDVAIRLLMEGWEQRRLQGGYLGGDGGVSSSSVAAIESIIDALASRIDDDDWKRCGWMMERLVFEILNEDVMEEEEEEEENVIPIMSARMISSVMKCCQLRNDDGVALVYGLLVIPMGQEMQEKRRRHWRWRRGSNGDDDDDGVPREEEEEEVEVDLIQRQPFLKTSHDVYDVTVSCLRRLGQDQTILDMEQKVMMTMNENDYSHSTGSSSTTTTVATTTARAADAWKQAFRQSLVLLSHYDYRQRRFSINDDDDDDENNRLTNLLASCLRIYNKARQPQAGLTLAYWIARLVDNDNNNNSDKTNSEDYYYDNNNTTTSNEEWGTTATRSLQVPSLLSSTDDILASVIEAFRLLKDYDAAIEIYFATMERLQNNNKNGNSSSSSFYPKSTTQGLRTLLSNNDIDGAVALLSTMMTTTTAALDQQHQHLPNDDNTTINNCLLLLARGLNKLEEWERIKQIYNLAEEHNLLSQELALLCLKAISHGDYPGKKNDKTTKQQQQQQHQQSTNNDPTTTTTHRHHHHHEQQYHMSEGEFKLRSFKKILRDMYTLTNTPPPQWTRRHYWTLKRNLLDRDLIRIMRWNTKRRGGTVKSNELKIAMEDYQRAAAALSSNDDEEGRIISTDVLLSLVKQAGYRQRHVRCRGNPIPDRLIGGDSIRIRQDEERREGRRLIRDVIERARRTTIEEEEEFDNDDDDTTTITRGYYINDPTFGRHVTRGLRALKGERDVLEFVTERVREKAEIRPDTFLQAVLAAKMLGDVEEERRMIMFMERAGFEFRDMPMAAAGGVSGSGDGGDRGR